MKQTPKQNKRLYSQFEMNVATRLEREKTAKEIFDYLIKDLDVCIYCNGMCKEFCWLDKIKKRFLR